MASFTCALASMPPPPPPVLLTPNGRFETGKRICLSISDYHPETWLPAWGLRLILEALISFFPTKGEGAIGSLDYGAEERKLLAEESREWCCPHCGPIAQLLPEPRPAQLQGDGGSGAPPPPQSKYAAEIAKMRFTVAPPTPAHGPAEGKDAPRAEGPTTPSAAGSSEAPSASSTMPPLVLEAAAEAKGEAEAEAVEREGLRQRHVAAAAAEPQTPSLQAGAAAAVGANGSGGGSGSADQAVDRAVDRPVAQPTAARQAQPQTRAAMHAAPAAAAPRVRPRRSVCGAVVDTVDGALALLQYAILFCIVLLGLRMVWSDSAASSSGLD
jgi:ubiquitin-conjugating enzyme E2 J1